MNYIDSTLTGNQTLKLNTRIDNNTVNTDNIVWTLTMDGNDDSSISFNTPNVTDAIEPRGYYQELSIDFSGFDIQDNIHYVLKGQKDSDTVYLGKVYVTSTDIANYTVHPSKYTEKISTNNYTILD
tara:strand:- start:567 stop:944 length:378 start_codon:yes stop_codon:yes gene_type:complete